MSAIDKQRIAAVRKLEQLGYTFAGDDRMHPANDAAAMAPTITENCRHRRRVRIQWHSRLDQLR